MPFWDSYGNTYGSKDSLLATDIDHVKFKKKNPNTNHLTIESKSQYKCK